MMVDASTDTILTPSWWDSDAVFEAKTRRKRGARKTQVAGKTHELVQTRVTEVESAMDTDAEPLVERSEEWREEANGRHNGSSPTRCRGPTKAAR